MILVFMIILEENKEKRFTFHSNVILYLLWWVRYDNMFSMGDNLLLTWTNGVFSQSVWGIIQKGISY